MQSIQPRFIRWIYTFTIFVSAFLVFQIQPLFGKYILPWFGGAASVWSTALVVFMTLLLVGYGYSTLLVRMNTAWQRIVHVCAMCVSVGVYGIPLALEGRDRFFPPLQWVLDQSFAPWMHVAGVILIAVGIPYTLLATTSSLLQHWSQGDRTGIPYRLYAVSNAGSLFALVSYPIVVEPYLSLQLQQRIWEGGFFAYCGLMVACLVMIKKDFFEASGDTQEVSGSLAFFSLRSSGRQRSLAQKMHTSFDSSQPEIPSTRQQESVFHEESLSVGLQQGYSSVRYMWWIGYAAVPSFLLVAVTTYSTKGIAAVPLLWVVPLVLYLVSFIVSFSGLRIAKVFSVLLVVSSGVALVFSVLPNSGSFVGLVVALMNLLLVGIVFHGRLYATRPAPTSLTVFYVMVAFGGALGSAFPSLIAPAVFDRVWEYPIILSITTGMAAWWARESLRTFFQTLRGKQKRNAAIALVLLGVVLTQVLISRNRVITNEWYLRNFYGTLHGTERIDTDTQLPIRVLQNGDIIHGMQFLDPRLAKLPTSYYARESGIGKAIAAARQNSTPLRVGVIGLGVGTVAAYCAPADQFVFYEINPQVVDVAWQHFSYLSACPSETVSVVVGDARLSLEKELRDGVQREFDVLAIDAFSDDSIPVHLLTREALHTYLAQLDRDGGILAYHVSNQYLNLIPVVHALAHDAHLYAVDVEYAPGPEDVGAYSSSWVLVTAQRDIARVLAGEQGDTDVERPADPAFLWTDDYSNLLKIIRW